MARNEVEFTDNSVKVKGELEQALVAFLHEASAEVLTQAERNTVGEDSGQLRRSWGKVVDKAKMQAIIGNKLEYAIYNEFGTGEYALEGNGRKGYWVYVKDNDTGKMAKHSKQYTLEEAQQVMAYLREQGLEAYYTKGMRPKRMLYKAFKMWSPKIQARAKQIFKEKGF